MNKKKLIFIIINIIITVLFYSIAVFADDYQYIINLSSNKFKGKLNIYYNYRTRTLSGHLSFLYDINANDLYYTQKFSASNNCTLWYQIDNYRENSDKWICYIIILDVKDAILNKLKIILVPSELINDGVLYLSETNLNNLFNYIANTEGKIFKLAIFLNNNIVIYNEYDVTIFLEIINFLKYNKLL